jgi:hypothetical protein
MHTVFVVGAMTANATHSPTRIARFASTKYAGSPDSLCLITDRWPGASECFHPIQWFPIRLIISQTCSSLATTLHCYLSLQHDSTRMSKTTQISQDAPSDIGRKVLLEINALSSEPDMTMQPQRSTLARRDSTGSSEAWWESEKVTQSDHFGTTLCPSNPENDPDNAEFSEKDSLLPTEHWLVCNNESTSSSQVANAHEPKILARYIYPSEHRPDTPPPAEIGSLSSGHWPTLASLIGTLIHCIIDFILDDDRPAVIEYSNEEAKQKTKGIQIEARVVKSNSPQSNPESPQGIPRPEKVIGIVALVPSGTDGHHRAVSITAKPKRVRQILNEEVVHLAEDVYGAQIKAALNGLRREV